jgi:hypothetical protein
MTANWLDALCSCSILDRRDNGRNRKRISLRASAQFSPILRETSDNNPNCQTVVISRRDFLDSKCQANRRYDRTQRDVWRGLCIFHRLLTGKHTILNQSCSVTLPIEAIAFRPAPSNAEHAICSPNVCPESSRSRYIGFRRQRESAFRWPPKISVRSELVKKAVISHCRRCRRPLALRTIFERRLLI